MDSYKNVRYRVKSKYKSLIHSFKDLFYYGCEVDTWLPEIMLLPYITLRWRQDHTWYRIIAPPGSGKSVHLALLSNYPQTYMLDEFTPKSFVSGFRGSGGTDPSTLPLLHNKVLVITDESTMMEQRQEDRNQVQAILRRTFDGSYSKTFGNIKDKQEYNSYFNMLVGSTPQIDRYFLYNQALGERFINYRLQIPDRKTLASVAYDNQFKNFNKHYLELKSQLHSFLKEFPKIGFNEIHITKQIGDYLINVADFIALIRTHITRDTTGQYVTTLPQAESAGRLVKQMTQTVLANAAMQGEIEIKTNHIDKAVYLGICSIGSVIVFVLYHIYSHTKECIQKRNETWFTPQFMGIRTALSLRTILKIIEDLAIHRILQIRHCIKQGGRGREYTLEKTVYDFLRKTNLFKYYIPPCKELLTIKSAERNRPTGNIKFKIKI